MNVRRGDTVLVLAGKDRGKRGTVDRVQRTSGGQAPSTIGTFLRSFTWGHARQLDKVSGQLLARAWAAGGGPGDAAVTIDIDSSIHETYGLQKQGGSKFTHTKVRGYHPLYSVIAGTGHSTYWESPEVFNRTVLEFIVRH